MTPALALNHRRSIDMVPNDQVLFENMKRAVWCKAQPVWGQDPAKWRLDPDGVVIEYAAYGDMDSVFGWDFDETWGSSERRLQGGWDRVRPYHLKGRGADLRDIWDD